MYYDINVSLNGHHFFATAERSVTSRQELKRVLPVMLMKFPVVEGFGISVSQHSNVGESVSVDEVMAEATRDQKERNEAGSVHQG